MNLSRRGHLNSRRGFRPIQATGGVVSEITVAGVRYRLHSFMAVGTHSFEVLDPGSEGLIDYLVVGGGGGGSTGGGGAGGVLTNGSQPVPLASLGTSTTLTVVVGAGGAGRLAHSSNNSDPGTARIERGDNGQPSRLGNLTALGGGGGGAYGDGGVPMRIGADAGSGGGGGGLFTNQTNTAGGHGTAGPVTARKDDASAAVQAAINNVAGSSSISAGGGLIHTTSG